MGITPNILCECHDSAMLLNLVCRGLGAAIVPYSMLSSFSLEHIKILNIEDNPFVIEPLVTWRTDSYLPKIAQEFLKLF
jgi:DNA-binding transcriptional LysR family regulator